MLHPYIKKCMLCFSVHHLIDLYLVNILCCRCFIQPGMSASAATTSGKKMKKWKLDEHCRHTGREVYKDWDCITTTFLCHPAAQNDKC